jgi:hypothetical protein
MIYVFDTNTFSEMSPYFPDIFRAFWSTFENAVAGGEVTSTREVLRELKNGPQNHVFEWCGRNPSVFPVPDARETAFVTKIFAIPQFSQLIGEKQTLRGTPVADPEFWGEVQPPASLKELDIPSRRAVFVPWKPSRSPAFGMGNTTFR